MDTHIYTYTMLFLPRECNVNDAVFRYKLKPPPTPPPRNKRPLTGMCVTLGEKEWGNIVVVCFLFLILKSNFVI